MGYIKINTESRKTKENTVLYIVVPCYNEQDVLRQTTKELERKLLENIENNNISNKSRILYVDDGSTDNTWSIIKEYYNKNDYILGLKLAKNKGHQNALHAGLMVAKDYCDISISIDADLQDDVNIISKFIDKYYEGNEIVYGVRTDRSADTAFKRGTAKLFYNAMIKLGIDIIDNHADCRLMSKSALEAFSEYKEFNLFLRGMIPTIGLKTDVVAYERKERQAGETKYPLSKMINLALDGITSFSTTPIRLVTLIGFVVFIISVVVLIYSLIRNLTGKTVVGWTSLVFSIWFLGGAQLIALGLIGEYIGKIYNEVKDRPKYFIETFLKK